VNATITTRNSLRSRNGEISADTLTCEEHVASRMLRRRRVQVLLQEAHLKAPPRSLLSAHPVFVVPDATERLIHRAFRWHRARFCSDPAQHAPACHRCLYAATLLLRCRSPTSFVEMPGYLSRERPPQCSSVDKGRSERDGSPCDHRAPTAPRAEREAVVVIAVSVP
jgi:hypothetical protein